MLAVACFFRTPIASGFTHLFGDSWDGRIETAILEHWYNVFRGTEHWNRVAYFYPVKDTLGYNDGYFLYGVIFSLFRALGADLFLASELVNIVVRLIGFFACYGFARRVAGQAFGWALLGAILFTVASSSYLQAGHAQLLTAAFAPLLGLLFWHCVTSLTAGRGARAALAGCAAALLYDAWLLTAFYMAWFTTLFAALMGVAWFALRLAARDRPLLPRPAVLWPLPVIGAVLLPGLVPFLLVYLPKIHETGGHGWDEILQLSPSLLDLLHVGRGNLLFGWMDRALTASLRPDFPDLGEHTIGLPPVLLALSLAGAVLAWGARDRPRFWRALSFGFLVSLAVSVHVGPFTLWSVIWRFVPGAGAIRAVTRYVIFLVWPASLLATRAASMIRLPGRAMATAALAAVLILEEITLANPARLDRPQELRFLASVPPAPPQCRSFFITGGTAPSRPVESLPSQHLSIDAMVIAETSGPPTLNADASFHPKGDELLLVRDPDYLLRVANYAHAHGVLSGLCAFDRIAMRWNTRPLPPLAVAPGQEVPFGTGHGTAGPVFIGWGWSEPEIGGWWTEGRETQMLLRVDAPAPHEHGFVLHAWARSLVTPAAPPPRVEVLANGRVLAEWHPAIDTADWQVMIPPGTVAPDGTLDLRFHVHDPRVPRALGMNNDARELGFIVTGIRLDAAPGGER